MVQVSIGGVILVTVSASILQGVLSNGAGAFLVFRGFTICFVFYFFWTYWEEMHVPGVSMRVSTGRVYVIVIFMKNLRGLSPFWVRGFWAFSLSVLHSALYFTFSEVSGRRLLGFASCFRFPSAFSWWLSLQKNVRGLPLWGWRVFGLPGF